MAANGKVSHREPPAAPGDGQQAPAGWRRSPLLAGRSAEESGAGRWSSSRGFSQGGKLILQIAAGWMEAVDPIAGGRQGLFEVASAGRLVT